jgi:hypothetical protein
MNFVCYSYSLPALKIVRCNFSAQKVHRPKRCELLTADSGSKKKEEGAHEI